MYTLKLRNSFHLKYSLPVLLFLSLFFCSSSQINAQSPDRIWGFGGLAGLQQYNGEYGNGFYNFDQAFYGFAGFSLSRYITDHIDIKLNTTMGELGHIETFDNKFQYRVFSMNINLKFNFFKPEKRIRPYVFVGAGYLAHFDKRSEQFFQAVQLPDAGIGISYALTPFLHLTLDETFIYTDEDIIDRTIGGNYDSYLQHSIGLVYSFGSMSTFEYDWNGMWGGKGKKKRK